MSKHANIVKDFLGSSKDTSLDYIRNLVLRHQHAKLTLKNGKINIFRIGPLEDTSYKDNLDILEDWEQYYLPEAVSMQVIGVLEKFLSQSLSDDLVLMVCEDGKVFAYDDELLHLVAHSLKELFECGPKYPGFTQYYRGQSFADMTEDEWNSVKKSDKLIEQKNKNLEISQDLERSCLRDLNIIMEKLQVEQPCRTSERHGGNSRRNSVKKSSRRCSDFKWTDQCISQPTGLKRVRMNNC